MSEQIRESLFCMEKNTQREGTNSEMGTGLGLLISKEFIDLHKEKVWVTSEVGSGTSICFTLPTKSNE